jgi:hypothetical protein
MKQLPEVYAWREDEISGLHHRADWNNQINCDSMASVMEWAEKFSGNHRLTNDVGLPLERCVIAAYQIGYLFDYVEMKRDDAFYKYMTEGLASILLHTIASYEMMGRGTINIKIVCSYNKWSEFCKILKCSNHAYTYKEILLELSEAMFKYQRWILYNHMGRIKRWNEQEFVVQYVDIIFCCCRLANKFNISLEEGFAYTMSKIQDGEIKRH